MIGPFGNDSYNDELSWGKGCKPTLLYYANSNPSPDLTASVKIGCGIRRMFLESLRVCQNPKYYQPVSEWFVAVSYNRESSPDCSIWLCGKSLEMRAERSDGYKLDLVPTADHQF
jgi:hypothetical protein